MNFDDELKELTKKIAVHLKDFALQLPYQLNVLIGSYMSETDVSNDWINATPGDVQGAESIDDSNIWFNETNKLRVQTGKYLQSFLPGKEDSATTVTYSNTGYKVVIGSKKPYLHETAEPNFIPAKKFVYNIKTRKKVPVMSKFFWYKYYSTKNEMFKIIALSVAKKLGVSVKKREHIAPAIDDLNKDDFNKLLNKYLDDLINLAGTR